MFFIQVAIKFLAYYNPNSLWIKYYKKVPESQLKNKETYIYAYIISTKLTNNF